MNYANVFGRTQKQFDMTMNREKITVADFFNSDIKYDVFFRNHCCIILSQPPRNRRRYTDSVYP